MGLDHEKVCLSVKRELKGFSIGGDVDEQLTKDRFDALALILSCFNIVRKFGKRYEHSQTSLIGIN